jgi:hypothetical protein
MTTKRTKQTTKTEKPSAPNYEELFNKVLVEIAEEGISARKACTVVGLERKKFYKMLEENEERSNQYARACEDRSDLIFEEILEIADDSSEDSIIVNKKGGESYEILNKEFVERSKVRIDARKWALGKMQPKKYGDKVDVDLSSGGERITIKLNLGNDES